MLFERKINNAWFFMLWIYCVYKQMSGIEAADQSEEINGFGKYIYSNTNVMEYK